MKQILQSLLQILRFNSNLSSSKSTIIAAGISAPSTITSDPINWSNPASKVSKYFSVHELTYLPSWEIHHIPSVSEQENLFKLANVMDSVRDLLNAQYGSDKGINVHVTIRPTSVNSPGSIHNEGNYNILVGGAAHSAHISGLAMDWDFGMMNCDEIRAKVLPELDRLGLRMENAPGTNWVHLDLNPPNPNRYFIP